MIVFGGRCLNVSSEVRGTRRQPIDRGHRHHRPGRDTNRRWLGEFNWSSQHLRKDVGMAGRRRSDRALRNKLRSPGRPSVARQEHQRRFWVLIATGLSSEDAATGAGVSAPLGARWFRKAGGMPPSTLTPSSKPLSERYCHLRNGRSLQSRMLKVQGAADRPAHGAVGIDDLVRIAPQCCHARRRVGLSGDHCAVAC
jgi:hypothetical protein